MDFGTCDNSLLVLPTQGRYYRWALEKCQKFMKREIDPTKLYKIMSMCPRMDIKKIP
jgi:hypothetical protein